MFLNTPEDKTVYLNILILLSGKGKRFADAGYTFPKPLIDIEGDTMIAKVIKNLTPAKSSVIKPKFIFVVQQEHCEKYDLENILRRSVGNNLCEVVKLVGQTEGAACSALMAKDYICNENPLLIANSDQLIGEFCLESWYDTFEKIREKKNDGSILVFKANHPRWSYARINKEKLLEEVAEKRVISEWATCGVYFFSKGSDFVESAESMIKKDIRTNNEFYVCPVYNEMVLQDKRVEIFECEEGDFHGLGTPEDLQKFLNSKSVK